MEVHKYRRFKEYCCHNPQSSHGLQELASSIFSYSTTTLVPAEQSAQQHIPEDWNLQITLHLDFFKLVQAVVDSSWNEMAHGDAREGKWRGNWRMEWVASILHTTSEHVYPALLPLTCTPRLPVVDRIDAYLNGLVRFAERRNLVSARVPSHFSRPIQNMKFQNDRTCNVHQNLKPIGKTKSNNLQ